METERQTMEQMIEAAEKRGWRLSALSHVGAAHVYSCILERKKTGNDGFPVYALGELRPNPWEALQSAWEHAQRPIDNPRVDARRTAQPKPDTPPSTLDDFLARNVGYRIRLEDALQDLQNALDGTEGENGWEV